MMIEQYPDLKIIAEGVNNIIKKSRRERFGGRSHLEFLFDYLKQQNIVYYYKLEALAAIYYTI